MTTASQTLREKQAPIKAAYRAEPSAAVVTLKSTGSLDSSSITCKPETSAATKEAHRVAGLHSKAGGPDAHISGELCSGDMLLDALVACAGVTLKAVATALGIPILSGKITAEGDLDFRGTLGVDKDAPVGITDIRLNFDLKFGERDGGPVTEDDVGRLGILTERYCVVLQTIVNKPQLNVRIVGHGGGKEEDGVHREVVWDQSEA
jgi:uncharacterized OsmC-like protein